VRARQRDGQSEAGPVSVLSDARALLSLRRLRVHFETKRGESHAVDDVSFDIHDGETLGLVGETGSGKTMTARSLLRLVPRPPGIYAGGQVLFRPKITCPLCSGVGCEACERTGRAGAPCPSCTGAGCPACEGSGIETIDLLTVSERRMRRIRGNHIAMISQDPGKALNPGLPIRQQLAEVFAEHRSDEILREAGIDPEEVGHLLRRDARRRTGFFERRLLSLPPLRAHHRRLRAVVDERIARALADTRIPNPPKVMQRYPHELSGGMKQRVMIAQALAANPELLIADEPTTALDVTIQARILDLLAELQERHHTAVLYISHDLSLVRRISDRVAVMYAGQLVEVGPAETILSRPMHPYTRGLLGAIPTTRHQRGSLVAIEGTVPEMVDLEPMCRFSGRCPYAAPICERRDPALETHASEHRVACFLYESAEDLGVAHEDMPTRTEAS
jgi:oligopeptide/dipeptide ABC transporter ATP-binding protein